MTGIMQCRARCILQNVEHTCACFLALRTRILESGPMPLYATPMLGVSKEIFLTVDSSTKVERNFFSVAITTPLTALIPSEVAPPFTAFNAYSICTNLPLGLKVVKEKEYCGPTHPTRQIIPTKIQPNLLSCHHDLTTYANTWL